MSPHYPHAEREQALCRRLPKFNTRTRQQAVVLTGREELAGWVDTDHVVRELMNNWTDLERLLCTHGAFLPAD